MMKFLIVKTSSLGDILHAFPVASYLKHKFPDCQIDWVVEEPFSELVKNNPLITHVFCISSKHWRKNLFKKSTWNEMKAFQHAVQMQKYDCVFDLQGNCKSGLVTFLTKSKHKIGFGSKTIPEWPNLIFTNKKFNPPQGANIREDYLYLVKSFWNDLQSPFQPEPILLMLKAEDQLFVNETLKTCENQHAVLVCPGSAWPNKQVTAEALRDFLKLLHQNKPSFFLFAWGNTKEFEVASQLHQAFEENSTVIKKLPLNALQRVMSGVDLIISMDSLPLHLAGMTKTPTLSVFGASSAKKYCPVGPQQHTFQGSCPYGQIFEKRCPILRTCQTGACIRGLSGQSIYNNLSKFY